MSKISQTSRVVADVWEKDVWEFQAKSGSSDSCRLLLRFFGKMAVQKMSGKTPGSPDIRLPDIRGLPNFRPVIKICRRNFALGNVKCCEGHKVPQSPEPRKIQSNEKK